MLVVMDLMTRRVEIAGITCEPTGAWLMQVARNLTDAEDGFLLGMRHLVLDRDPVFTAAFRKLLMGSGVKVLRLPARSPNLNAYVERFVLSIKTECIGKIVPLGEAHLRWAVSQYIQHYHVERPHQGLDGALIEGDGRAVSTEGEVRCRERVGGMLRFYYREAAWRPTAVVRAQLGDALPGRMWPGSAVIWALVGAADGGEAVIAG